MGEKYYTGGNMMTESMIETYLAVLGCSDAREVCEENLFRLQAAHLAQIPYSNLSFYKTGTLQPLDTDSLFDRLIIRRKGGYCFELNGLFGELLRGLGYEVTEYFARWHFGGTEKIPMRRHRVLKVVLNSGTFLADAGIGSPCPVTPLKFELDVIQQKNYRAYRIVKDPELGNVVEAETPEGFLPYFSFTEDPHFPQDFIYVHAYCVQQPDSAFRTKIFMHKLTAEKQWALLNPTPDSPEYALRIWNNGEVSLTPIHSKEKLLSILTEVFGLNYSIGDLPEINRKVLL